MTVACEEMEGDIIGKILSIGTGDLYSQFVPPGRALTLSLLPFHL